ncbi:MAG: porin family protein [Gammaproteobacteria bacterium]|nr:porin family protein [Gammaproteobacteria bacterium]
MNTKKIIASLTLVAGLAAAVTAQAEGKIYVGAKLGSADSDIPGFYDDALTAGIYGGYNMLGQDAHIAANLNGGTLAVEGEVNTTTVKGKSTTGGGTKWDITSLGAYAAYRHPLSRDFYLKGKIGLVHYDINISAGTPAGIGTSTSLAAGIGAGWKIGPGRIEADVATYQGDLLQAGIGFHMAF